MGSAPGLPTSQIRGEFGDRTRQGWAQTEDPSSSPTAPAGCSDPRRAATSPLAVHVLRHHGGLLQLPQPRGGEAPAWLLCALFPQGWALQLIDWKLTPEVWAPTTWVQPLLEQLGAPLGCTAIHSAPVMHSDPPESKTRTTESHGGLAGLPLRLGPGLLPASYVTGPHFSVLICRVGQ